MASEKVPVSPFPSQARFGRKAFNRRHTFSDNHPYHSTTHVLQSEAQSGCALTRLLPTIEFP